MTRLEHLKISLLDMSPEELRARIRAIREDRRLRKEPAKVRKERVRNADGARTNILSVLKDMSPEEQEAFLKELEGDTA